ncbi:MAG: hypothetical protein RJA70_3035 [Pseudomonadota bacterium]
MLLVEDCATTRTHCSALLTRVGYSIEAVDDAQKALALLKLRGESAPLILLIDWELPGMSGLQLVSVLGSMPFRVKPYVIMLTSRSTPEDVAKALNRGAHDYIKKPLQEAEFVSRLGVAERTVRLQRQLVERAEELEAALKRVQLQEHLLSRDPGADARTAGKDAPPIDPGALVFNATAEVLEKLSYKVLKANKCERPSLSGIAAWTGIAIPAMDLWMDICLVAPSAVADSMASKVIGQDVICDATDWLAEVVTLIRSHVRRMLEAEAIKSVGSAQPRCYLSWNNDHESRTLDLHFEITLEAGTISLLIGCAQCHLHELPLAELKPGLLLADAVHRANQPARTIAKSGSALTPDVILELQQLADRSRSVAVLEVSAFARRALDAA